MADVHDTRPEAPPSSGRDPGETDPVGSTGIHPRPAARKGRCANHPGETQVAACDVCGRPLCVACAVPVRGSVVGPECVATVVPDIPEPAVSARPRSWGRGATVAGFSIILAASILPWARYGDASGPMEAWAPHWSLLALASAVAGLVTFFFFRGRRSDPLIEAGLLLGFAAVALLGAVFHGVHPPPLSTAATIGWGLGLAGGILAAVGAAANMIRALGHDR
jgi:hypothetical protein